MSAVQTSLRLCGGMLVAMPTAMPVAPLTSRFGSARRQDDRLGARAVVVGAERHRLLLDLLQDLVGDARQAAFGVAHRRRGIAVERAEVARSRR